MTITITPPTHPTSSGDHRTRRRRDRPRSSPPRRSTSSPTCTSGSPAAATTCCSAASTAATRFSNGADPDFLPLTAGIRADPGWRVAGPGPGLEDRRVEITGPTDRKMTINALNCGAKVWLADMEDATSPTWTNVIGGQHSLFDAIRGQIDFTSPEGKEYRVGRRRPRRSCSGRAAGT